MKKIFITILSVLTAASICGCKNISYVKTVTSSDKKVTVQKDSSENDDKSAEAGDTSSYSENDDHSESNEKEYTNEKTESRTDSSNDEENDQESEENASFNPEDYSDAAYELYQSGIDMYEKVLLRCPYRLDYDSSDSSGFVLISDPSVTGIDDIVSLYCTVFTEPDSRIYERYSEKDGKVYFSDASRGKNMYYTGTLLEYVSGDENEMTFNAVSNYSDPETGEEMESKTSEFTITLTDDGYKISEFNYPQ